MGRQVYALLCSRTLLDLYEQIWLGQVVVFVSVVTGQPLQFLRYRVSVLVCLVTGVVRMVEHSRFELEEQAWIVEAEAVRLRF